MRLRVMLVVAGTSLACACGHPAAAHLPAGYHGVPVTPAPTTYSAPPTVPYDPDAAPAVAIGSQMEVALLNQVGGAETIKPDCGKSLVFNGKTKTIRCYARYGGVAVPFSVTIGGDANPTYTLQVTQLQALVTSIGVRQAWAQQNSGTAGTFSCDRTLPQAALVPFGKPTTYTCADGANLYAVEIDSDPTGGAADISFDYVGP